MGNIGPNINPGGSYRPPMQQGQAAPVPGSITHGAGQAQIPLVLTPLQQAMLAKQLGELLLAPLLAYQHQMSPQELQLFMKNLLQLPADIQMLFYQLATGEQTAATQKLLALLKQNPKISMEELQILLKEAVTEGEKEDGKDESDGYFW